MQGGVKGNTAEKGLKVSYMEGLKISIQVRVIKYGGKG